MVGVWVLMFCAAVGFALPWVFGCSRLGLIALVVGVWFREFVCGCLCCGHLGFYSCGVSCFVFVSLFVGCFGSWV